MANLGDEIDEIIKQLPQHQLDALKGLFKNGEPAPTVPKRRGIPPKDKVHETSIALTCRLCGTRSIHLFKSSSPLPSEMPVNTCPLCETVLSEKTVKELVEIAIRNACACTAGLKSLKKYADEWYARPKKEEPDEASTCGDGEGSTVQEQEPA